MSRECIVIHLQSQHSLAVHYCCIPSGGDVRLIAIYKHTKIEVAFFIIYFKYTAVGYGDIYMYMYNHVLSGTK